ncbi:MAG TPA: methyltransferase [Acidobacteriaceae bacterium]|jgi:hypothetical protein|nr:methyltransferase [Acidobacteriaceae bacterium]
MSALHEILTPAATLTAPPSAPPAPAPQELLLGVGLAYIAPAALNVAVKLRIPDLLGAGAKDVATLAAQSGSDAAFLFRILRTLECVGIFTRTDSLTFALTPAGLLLRSDVDDSMADAIEWLTDPLHYEIYGTLRHSVENGVIAFDALYKEPFFHWLARPENREESAVFNNAMTAISGMCTPAILEAYDFGAFTRMVDVGGGHGALLRSILKAHPQLSGTVADMENVIADTRAAIAVDGLESRCDAAVCNFFEAVPLGGDGYILKHIIHDWEDSAAITILRNIRKVIPSHGRVLLAECVLDNGAAPHPGKMLDLEMMAFVGGKERTEAEFAELFAQAGFQLRRVIPTRSPVALLEAVPV